jgi:hypothetical protein
MVTTMNTDVLAPAGPQKPAKSELTAMSEDSGNQPPETERPVSDGRSCAGCGGSLEGRRLQARYCSDRCRYGPGVQPAYASGWKSASDWTGRSDSGPDLWVHI